MVGKTLKVERKDLESFLEALSSARDILVALDTAGSISRLDPVVKLEPLTKLVDSQAERLAILLRPLDPPEGS